MTRLVVFSRVITRVGVCFLVGLFSLGCAGAHMEERKIFTSCRHLIPSGLIQLVIASVTKVHAGRAPDVLRYFFSQDTSIAMFLASISRRSMPPSFRGLYRRFRLIEGVSSRPIGILELTG